jgi:hypothetical protein
MGSMLDKRESKKMTTTEGKFYDLGTLLKASPEKLLLKVSCVGWQNVQFVLAQSY